jgi:hypothetical protein
MPKDDKQRSLEVLGLVRNASKSTRFFASNSCPNPSGCFVQNLFDQKRTFFVASPTWCDDTAWIILMPLNFFHV